MIVLQIAVGFELMVWTPYESNLFATALCMIGLYLFEHDILSLLRIL